MAYKRAKMFNRKAARGKSMADSVVLSLKLTSGMVLVDIGSGGGFFTFLFSKEIGETGKIYTVDSNAENLEYIEQQTHKKGMKNIIPVLVAEDKSPAIPETVDLVFLRNVYHHLNNRSKYFSRIKTILKPAGKVAIIEYIDKGSRFSFHRRFGHYVLPEVIDDEMTQAGFKVDEQFTFLPEQSFTLFSPR